MPAFATALRTKQPVEPPPRLVLNFDSEETHWHRCPNPNCRTVWAHTNDNSMSYFERIRAHECPKCRTWTGAQVDIDKDACEDFIATTMLKVVGFVRCWSPQNGF